MRSEQFKVLQELGEGFTSKCFLAKHLKQDYLCVIKQIKISGMPEEFINQTMNQVRILSVLKHPNIIQFIGTYIESQLHIVTKYAGGGDLYKMIKLQKDYFEEDRIVSQFIQICQGIKYIHDKNIIHRDIKSHNIFLTKYGNIKIGDFGVSKVLSAQLQSMNTVIGTPYYMSPEMCQNKQYTSKTDIWSLGVLLYEMTTLSLPFQAQSLAGLVLKILRGKYEPIPDIYSESLKKLIDSMLTIHPQYRPDIRRVLDQLYVIRNRLSNHEVDQKIMQMKQCKNLKEEFKNMKLRFLSLLNENQDKQIIIQSPKIVSPNNFRMQRSPLFTPQYKKINRSNNSSRVANQLSEKNKKPQNSRQKAQSHIISKPNKKQENRHNRNKSSKQSVKDKKYIYQGLKHKSNKQTKFDYIKQEQDIVQNLDNQIQTHRNVSKKNTHEQTLETLRQLIKQLQGHDVLSDLDQNVEEKCFSKQLSKCPLLVLLYGLKQKNYFPA